MTETPKRIQRKRTAGWRMPFSARYVGRPSGWENPYVIGQRCPHLGTGEFIIVRDAAHAVQLYREYMERGLRGDVAATLRDALDARLHGHDLACWCALDQPCHADVLLELANA